MSTDERLLYDQITQICKSCGAEYTHFLDEPIAVDQLVTFLKTKVVRFCSCDVNTCDVKVRFYNVSR